MRKIFPFFSIFLCLVLFLFFYLHSGAEKGEPIQIERRKPYVPEPIVVRERPHPFRNHPWVKIQPGLQELSIEVERDLLACQEVCNTISHESGIPEEQLTLTLIRTLLFLQRTVPFAFPENLYNVLTIEKTAVADAPSPFEVYQRLYLGETELGMPFYLDVRVFEPEDVSCQEIIDWHLERIMGEVVQVHKSGGHQTYIVEGLVNPAYPDYSHGFAAAQGERGLYLDCKEVGGRLFVAYAEAPLSSFHKHLPSILLPH